MAVTLRSLRTTDWAHVRDLFGANGACGGCWCMHWRRKRGEHTGKMKERNRRDFKRLLEAGEVHGVLAFDGDDCVGWCNYGPKADYDRLCRSPKLGTADNDAVWSIPCFFTKVGYRKRGIGQALLAYATAKLSRRRGVRVVEGYPTRAEGRSQASAFVFTGLASMFEKLGFQPHPRTAGTKGMRLYRKAIGSQPVNSRNNAKA